jgi:uncharacterized protein YceH (UPF0502 family)
MPHFELSPVETRILGCLLEKERTTPENYPISLNALTAAANQSTNRDPVTSYDERTIDAGLTELRQQKLATMIHAAGSRVPKYRHNLPDHYELTPREIALLCVLMLRGPQTPGELRTRTERLAPFPSLEEVESTLNNLARGDDPLVRLLPQQPGQKERRYVQLLSGEPTAESLNPAPQTIDPGPGRSAKIEALEAELASVRTELHELRNQFETFRKQFES